MAWIESHQELARHPKTKKLARLLGVSVPAAIGHLHLLWWWAVDYADDGWLGRYTAEDVADAVLWEGEPQKFWDALLESGFFDRGAEGAEVHDWDEYAGRLIEQRRKDAERKRLSRQHPDPVPPSSNGRPPDVHSPSGVTVPNRTGQNQTEQNQTKPKGGVARAEAARPPKEPQGNPRVQAVIEAFRTLSGDVYLTPRDHAAIKRSDVPPELIAQTYDAVARGAWGDDFMRNRLSVHEAIEWANAYAAAQQGDSPFDTECLCSELRERLTRHPGAYSYCGVHGDVRELA